MPKPKELPKFEEYKAPWEVNSEGEDIPEEDQKLDPAKLKKYVYGLLSDKNRFATRADEASAKADELEKKLADATDSKELEKLQGEVKKARDEAAAAKEQAKAGANALKWEIALEKGLTKTQAKRLVGATREELEADADELIAEFGTKGKGGKNDDDEGDDEGVRRAPRRKLNNSGDPDPDQGGKGGSEPDPNEVAKNWLANR